MPKYVDVILPLPLQGMYTYTLPVDSIVQPKIGQRIIVPFGNRKFHTGIISRLHNEQPSFPTKPALEILDKEPIIIENQLLLWQWISSFYYCSLGEVFKAALPSGLRLESESSIILNENWDNELTLSPNEGKIWEALCGKREQTIASLQKTTGIKNILHTVKGLLEKGVVQMKEEIRNTYKPKTVTCVRFSEKCHKDVDRNEVLDTIRLSPQQKKLFDCFTNLKEPVEKQTLLRESGCSDAILRALCTKGVVETYAKPIERLQASTSPICSPPPTYTT